MDSSSQMSEGPCALEGEAKGALLQDIHEELEEAAQLIAASKNIVFFTGAGISAESGIPTFRDPEVGVWKNKMMLVLFGTPMGWKLSPNKAWKAFRKFLEPIVKAKPNPGHYAINRLGSIPGKNVSIITQNVDMLHQDSGSANHPCPEVIEIHGSIQRLRCAKCGSMLDRTKSLREIYEMETGPRCHHTAKGGKKGKKCNGHARPDAVLFTESVDDHTFFHAIDKVRECDVFISVGTSGKIQPAASLVDSAIKHGAKVITINLNESKKDLGILLRGPSGVILPALVDEVERLLASQGDTDRESEEKEEDKEKAQDDEAV